MSRMLRLLLHNSKEHYHGASSKARAEVIKISPGSRRIGESWLYQVFTLFIFSEFPPRLYNTFHIHKSVTRAKPLVPHYEWFPNFTFWLRDSHRQQLDTDHHDSRVMIANFTKFSRLTKPSKDKHYCQLSEESFIVFCWKVKVWRSWLW